MSRPLVRLDALEPEDQFVTPGGTVGRVTPNPAREGHVAVALDDDTATSMRGGTLVEAIPS